MTSLMRRKTQIFRHALVVAVLSGCTRNVQAWPPPLVAGTKVSVRFGAPRVIAFDNAGKPDSVAGVKELRGRVVSLNHDSLSVAVSQERNVLPQETRLQGREIEVLLDQSTFVTENEIDGWRLGYGLLAGVVLIFAGIVASGS
jgi:hypothetical protein